MVVGAVVIVAGIGCRKGVSAAQVLAAIEAAIAEHGLAKGSLSALATLTVKRGEAGITAAALEFGIPLMVVEPSESSASGLLTHSSASLEVSGSPSASESAALAAAGPNARLAGPRIAVGPVTCAIALSGDDS